MPRVDPQDDSIRRWVVHHYRYDPQRRERRHVLVYAFDDDGADPSRLLAEGELPDNMAVITFDDDRSEG